MTANGHRGWHTLHGRGRRLISDDERLIVNCQVRVLPNGSYGNRFIEIHDREQGIVMCLAFSPEQHLIGQTFGQTQSDVRSAMEALFARKGLGSSGLTFKGKSSASLDQTAAAEFIDSVPRGWHTTYQHVAHAGGTGQQGWGRAARVAVDYGRNRARQHSERLQGAQQ